MWQRQAQTPGEPIFVPDPNGKDEDDGTILSVVLDGPNRKSYLLALNAKDFTEISRADLETSTGFGFSWVSCVDNSSRHQAEVPREEGKHALMNVAALESGFTFNK